MSAAYGERHAMSDDDQVADDPPTIERTQELAWPSSTIGRSLADGAAEARRQARRKAEA